MMNPTGCSDVSWREVQSGPGWICRSAPSISTGTININVSMFMPRTGRNLQKQILYYYDDSAKTGHKKARMQTNSIGWKQCMLPERHFSSQTWRSSRRACRLFLALLSLFKALLFSRCSCFTLAEASSSLANIALGEAGNVYTWSRSVAWRLWLTLLSPLAPCLGKICKYINNSNTEMNNFTFQFCEPEYMFRLSNSPTWNCIGFSTYKAKINVVAMDKHVKVAFPWV